VEESEISIAEKFRQQKKAAVEYLTRRAADLDRSMAENFTKKHFTLASHDAKMLATVMDVLGQIDVS
jgi:hypothetical protein